MTWTSATQQAETWTSATQQSETWTNATVQSEIWTAAGSAPPVEGDAPMMRFNDELNSQLLAVLEDF